MNNSRTFSRFFQFFTAVACGMFLFCSSIAYAEIVIEKVEEKKKEALESLEFVHPPEGLYDNYASVLKKYVGEDGMVDYQGLKADRKELDDFVASMANVELEAYRKWYDKDKFALWINAYNAFTLQIVIDHYPIKATFPRSMMYPENSIQQIPRHAEAFYLRIVNFSMTLNNISNNVLRDQFRDPRMHVALAGASVSRAPLLNVAYNGDMIDEQLKRQAELFLADSRNFRIDLDKKVIYLSKIFQWYAKEYSAKYKGEDIKGEVNNWSKGVLDYVRQHIHDEEQKAFIENETYDIEFLDYDWTLNERKQ